MLYLWRGETLVLRAFVDTRRFLDFRRMRLGNGFGHALVFAYHTFHLVFLRRRDWHHIESDRL
jgi:hypothetical protein